MHGKAGKLLFCYGKAPNQKKNIDIRTLVKYILRMEVLNEYKTNFVS